MGTMKAERRGDRAHEPDRPVALGYLRISEDPDDLRAGVKRQREDLAALADRLGVDLVHVYEDNDVSASKIRGSTTDWARLVARLDSERIDYVLGWKMDRLGRRLSDIEELDDRAQVGGLRVWTTAEGDVLANPAWPLLAAVAKMEARNTSYRVRRAHESRRARGSDSAGGVRPYGYADDRMTQVPVEVAVLREMAALATAGNLVTGIAKTLQERGIPTVRGSKWYGSTVRRTLRNPRYVGRLIHRGEDIGEGGWEPVFTRSEWNALQAALDKTEKKRPGPITTSLLGPVLRCGKCLGRMEKTQHSHGKTGGEKYAAYRCPTCYRSRKADLVDRYVIERLLSETDPDVAPVLARLDAEIDAAEQAIVDLDLEIHVATEKYRDHSLDARDFYPIIDRLRKDHDAVEKRRADLDARRAEAVSAEHAAGAWDSLTHDEKRAAIARRILVVELMKPKAGRPGRVLDDDQVRIVWRELGEG